MKGIVFTEFLEMVEQAFSPDMADRILDEAAPASGGAYTAVGQYDHQELIGLVATLSKASGTPVPDLVRAFGRHLFGRFVTLYPAFFTGVTDSFVFLEGIERYIHTEVRKLYPDAELPTFEVHRDGSTGLVMDYRSTRPFADLALGLIEGCIAHFKQPIAVRVEALAAAAGGAGTSARFTLARQAA